MGVSFKLDPSSHKMNHFIFVAVNPSMLAVLAPSPNKSVLDKHKVETIDPRKLGRLSLSGTVIWKLGSTGKRNSYQN
jgi:hypothetical protein